MDSDKDETQPKDAAPKLPPPPKSKPLPAAQADQVKKLARVPEGAPKRPTGPLTPGAPPTEEEILEHEAHEDAADLLTVERLGEIFGYLPARWPMPAAHREGRLRATAPLANPRYWIYAGAKAYHRWPEGAEMTRADFAKAVRDAHDHKIS